VVVIAAMTALLAVLLEPAGLLFTVFGSQVLRLSPVAISVLIAVSGFAGAASYVLGGYLSDRFGRRWLAIVLTVDTAIAASLSFATGDIGFFAGNVLWSAFASAATPVFGAWTAELFPTRARATAEAMLAVAAAAGGIVGLQFVGFIAPRVGLGHAIELCGLAAITGVFFLFLLPETKQAPLPD
jgi:MFS family permease